MLLRRFILLACQAVLTLADSSNYFKVLIREIDNPAGTLANGQTCSEFGYLGVGCNMYLRAAVSATGANVSTSDSLALTNPINTHMETRISNLNLVVEDKNAGTVDSFSSFDLHIQLASDADFTSIIDDYVIHVSTNQEQGVYTYTSNRPGTLATTISIAWSTNIAPPPTTVSTTTGVPFTGSTLPPTTTPTPPVDCSQVANQTSGVQTIYPDGTTAVQVYCDQTSYGTYTVIQSRGTNGENTTFNITYPSYSATFGTPGKGYNYWFGLDNMHSISGRNDYALQIDLCCGNRLVKKQIYHKFKVDTPDNNYKLTATADIAGVGLDYSSTNKDLSAAFSTYEKWNGGVKKRDSCDQFEFFDDEVKPVPPQVAPYGGWWYGSCGNNLNGFLYKNRNGNCTIDLATFDNNHMLGINMRTTTGQGYEGYDVDLQSYDRVRMALFTFDSALVDMNDDSFCKDS